MAASFKDTLAAGSHLDEPGVVLGSPLDGTTLLRAVMGRLFGRRR